MTEKKSQPTERTIQDLNRLYDAAEEADKHIFQEQRSNILLVAGEHYSKKNSAFWSRVRDSIQLSEEQKLRLTKNHLHRVANIYINNIFSLAPGVTVLPKNEKELRDTKSAELNLSVWQDWKQGCDYRQEVRKDIEDFVKQGEVACIVKYDPDQGPLIGFEPLIDDTANMVDPMTGAPSPMMAIDPETGKPVPDTTKPVFRGKIVAKRIYGFNFLRVPTSRENVSEGCCILRDMVDVKVLEKKYASDPDKLKFIKATSDQTYLIFDSQSADYDYSKEQVMVREFYEPPCREWPMGYFWHATPSGILEQGELPEGVWPIIFTGMDDIPTSPRKRSIIKQGKPYQAEINRAASSIATAQVTLGDDKLLSMVGTKITQGAKLPGVRNLQYTGSAPTYLPGRDGGQFVDYMRSQIQELYQVMNLDEEGLDKAVQSTDSIAELLKIARHKKKFSLYAEKIESFETKKCEIVLLLAQKYYDDDTLIPAIGRAEIVNIAEFRASSPHNRMIKLEPSNDDYETKFGKHVTFNTILQYVGSKLERDDIGKILRSMPYVNNEKIFEDFTMDYDTATNMILALDRGEFPQSSIYDEHKYIVKRLTNRIRMADFQFLPPQVQMAYEKKKGEHQQLETQYMLQIKKAQEQLIPATGPLVKVDMYVDDPENPGKTNRAKMPIDSLRWLEERLREQGIELSELSKIQDAAVAEMSTRFLNGLGNSVPAAM